MGSALAGALHQQGVEVILGVRPSDVVGGSNSKRRFSLKGRICGEFEISQRAATPSFLAGFPGEVWLTVRAWQLAELPLGGLCPERTFVGSNGWVLDALVSRWGVRPAGRFTAWFGCRRTASDSFTISDGGGLEWVQDSERTVSALEGLQSRIFGGERFSRMETVEWRKGVWNAALNPLAALKGATNGDVLEDPAFRKLFEEAVREGVRVAQFAARLAELTPAFPSEEEAVALLVRATEGTAANRNSLRVDLESGRPTELPWILDPLLAKAKQGAVPVPTLVALRERLANR